LIEEFCPFVVEAELLDDKSLMMELLVLLEASEPVLLPEAVAFVISLPNSLGLRVVLALMAPSLFFLFSLL
jgi:hypothetical protein